jgi:hypothetical protein
MNSHRVALINGTQEGQAERLGFGGREGIRTPGLLVANEALSQLSYSPTSSKKILPEQGSPANRRNNSLF